MTNYPLSKFTGQQVVQYYDPSGPKAGDMFWSMATSREGCYIANGADYAQADEPELFAEIGTTFNTQINPTTGSAWAAPSAGRFRVPDMRGLVPRGAGTAFGASALGVGEYQSDTVQPHSHNLYAGGGPPAGSTTVVQTIAATTGTSNTFMVRSESGAASPGAIGNETRVKARGGNWFIRRFNPSAVAYGAGMATAVTPGLVYQSDEVNIAPYVTSAQAGFAVVSAVAVVKKDKNNKYRMDFNITANFNSAALTALGVAISGLQFAFTRALSGRWGGIAGTVICPTSYTVGTTNSMVVESSSVTATGTSISGSVDLLAKPSWI